MTVVGKAVKVACAAVLACSGSWCSDDTSQAPLDYVRLLSLVPADRTTVHRGADVVVSAAVECHTRDWGQVVMEIGQCIPDPAIPGQLQECMAIPGGPHLAAGELPGRWQLSHVTLTKTFRVPEGIPGPIRVRISWTYVGGGAGGFDAARYPIVD